MVSHPVRILIHWQELPKTTLDDIDGQPCLIAKQLEESTCAGNLPSF